MSKHALLVNDYINIELNLKYEDFHKEGCCTKPLTRLHICSKFNNAREEVKSILHMKGMCLHCDLVANV